MHLLRLGVCCAAAGLTYTALQRQGVGTALAQAVEGSRKAAEKSVSPHDEAADSPLATVRRLMRAGDVEGIKSFLRALAEKDPPEFFKILRQVPYLAGPDDMSEIIGQAGARLAWRDPQALELLRQAGGMSWGCIAWDGYVGAQVGKVPDAEILDLALRIPGSSLGPLVQDAVEKRPQEFMALLEERGCTDLLDPFFTGLRKAHPELTLELLRSVPPGLWGNENYQLGVFCTIIDDGTSPENLMAMLDLMNGGSFSPGDAITITAAAFASSSRDQQDGILEAIARQPEPLKSAMLKGVIGVDFSLEVSDLDAVMRMSSSLDQQQKALAAWLKMQPDLDPSGQGWLDRLPTEKLRAKALELKNAVDDGVRRPAPLER
jgi:hypothetical protein